MRFCFQSAQVALLTVSRHWNVATARRQQTMDYFPSRIDAKEPGSWRLDEGMAFVHSGAHWSLPFHDCVRGQNSLVRCPCSLLLGIVCETTLSVTTVRTNHTPGDVNRLRYPNEMSSKRALLSEAHPCRAIYGALHPWRNHRRLLVLVPYRSGEPNLQRTSTFTKILPQLGRLRQRYSTAIYENASYRPSSRNSGAQAFRFFDVCSEQRIPIESVRERHE